MYINRLGLMNGADGVSFHSDAVRVAHCLDSTHHQAVGALARIQ